MRYSSIEQALSVSRFSTYRNAVIAATGDDCRETALKLYEWNAQLSSRFFFSLHIYEVAIRNAVSDAISMRYGVDWPANPAFLSSLPSQDRSTLIKAMQRGYHGVGKLLPELKFVWFENMMTRRHDARIWKPYIKQVFQNAPTGLTEEQIRGDLKQACYVIRKFRNRCGHHEPVFNNPRLRMILPLMAQSVEWRCPDTHMWLVNQETVTDLLANPVI